MKQRLMIIAVLALITASVIILKPEILTTYALTTPEQTLCLQQALQNKKILTDQANQEYASSTEVAQQVYSVALNNAHTISDPGMAVKSRYDALRVFHADRTDAYNELKATRDTAFKQYDLAKHSCYAKSSSGM